MEAGSYGYGLNLALDARVDSLANNSKRVMRDFMLVSVTNALANAWDDTWSVILGTEDVDFFGDYVIASLIFGDGTLPHFLPKPLKIEKGDYIVVKARNVNATGKRLALLFDGYHV